MVTRVGVLNMRTWRGARRETATGGIVRPPQRAPQRLLDLVDAIGVGDGRAVVFQHVVEVEAEAVGRGRDARVDDGQAQLVEHGGGAREAVAAVRRIDQDGGGAALAVRLHGHQRFIARRRRAAAHSRVNQAISSGEWRRK